ncbi:Putative nucleoside transporter YegT [Pirellulimonas nuda]|uniref:Nucleoside transporter YegT n=1 Tax=Pirellulimonas nuda TaxID=2528009 RepID=A0A518DIH2_9BACT|nr:MFS transporter [Pirellulimonas nuda]QDU91275.1 Putative nucleoside transporter YegT [Pirellulimonas nuda]
MNVQVRLSIMMFLQFFIWGAWYVSMTGFIGAAGMDGVTGAAYTVGPIAAIIAPFFLGMVADRFFASQRVLGALHLVGGGLLLAAPMAAAPFVLGEAPADSSIFYKVMLHDAAAYRQPFTLLLLAHMLCYMPTLGLTASLSFQNLENPEKQFPAIRVLGTIGWIAGNLAVGLLPGADASPAQFYLAGGAALLLGLFSFTLPHTPPPAKGKPTTIGQILGSDSLGMMKNPSYAVFIICSFLICIPLAGYYQQARNFVDAVGLKINGSATTTMSFGQMSEVVFMVLMPLFFARLGVKWMLLAGMGAWVLRYALFALGADDHILWMVFLGVLLHGICYDFFFVTGMIYADQRAPSDVRNQAQSFLVFVTQGLGLGIGAKVFFAHVLMNTEDGVADWYTIWLYPCLFAAAVMVVFFLFFWDKAGATPRTDRLDAAEAASRVEAAQ